MIINLWQDLSNDWQDFIIFIAYLSPVILMAYLLFFRLSPFSMIKTLLKRYKKINILITIILGICLSVSLAIQATAYSYKAAMANVANRFELVVTAPGSKTDMMLSTVYLKPTATPLLQKDIYEKIANDEKIAVTAPIAYGDSYTGFPIVGSTNSFIKYLSENQVSGNYFKNKNEAIVGAGVNLVIGDTFVPQHGIHKGFTSPYTFNTLRKNESPNKNKAHRLDRGVVTSTKISNLFQKKNNNGYFCPDENSNDSGNYGFSEKSSHAMSSNIVDNKTHYQDSQTAPIKYDGNDTTDAHNTVITVVGKMPITHSPWDKAIITTVESVWSIHGLPSGHPPDDDHLGEPFDMDYFSGTPAILVHPKKRFHAYSLSKKYTSANSMAFIPATVLNKLNSQLDDITGVLSRVSSLFIILVLSLALVTVALLGKLFEKHFKLLQSLGSPKRFITSILWGYVTALAFWATVLGCLFGYLLSVGLASYVERRLSVLLEVSFGWNELILCAMFFALSSMLGLIPALIREKKA